jgi:hypothetical protein
MRQILCAATDHCISLARMSPAPSLATRLSAELAVLTRGALVIVHRTTSALAEEEP